MIFWGSFRDHPVQVSKDHKVQQIITDMHAIQQRTASCTIPSNMSVFFPATTSFCYNTASMKQTEDELRACASLQKSDPDTNVIIDGINLNTFAYDIKNARVQSSLFNISVPADSILGISPQNVSGIAAGDWVFLKPGALQSGKHEISFTGKLNGTKSDVSYSLDIINS